MSMSENQRDMIMRLYPFLTNKEIAEVVGVTEMAVHYFALRNGMIKQKPNQREEKHRSIKYVTCPTPYWELVKQYKEQTPLRRFNHPFFEATKKIYKTKNQDGTD